MLGAQSRAGRTQVVSLVASVPLSDEAWRPLEQGELLILRDGTSVRAL
jgi:predicted glutamine amidotransferase